MNKILSISLVCMFAMKAQAGSDLCHPDELISKCMSANNDILDEPCTLMANACGYYHRNPKVGDLVSTNI